MDWLWQNLMTDLIWLLLILGFGALMGWLKRNGSLWAGPLLFAVAGSAMAAVCIFTFLKIVSLPKRPPPPITTENVEQHVRQWLDDSSLSTRKQNDDNCIFQLITTLPNGDPISINRLKNHDQYLVLATSVMLAPEHKAQLAKLSKAESNELIEEINLEMSRAKIDFNTTSPLTSVTLASRMPITGLTEYEFLQQLDNMDNAIIEAKTAIILGLNRYSH